MYIGTGSGGWIQGLLERHRGGRRIRRR